MKNKLSARCTAPNRVYHPLVLIVLSFILLPNSIFSQQFYVSPSGKAKANGTLANPWDLQTALNQPSSVVHGSTIYLLGGLYKGNFTSLLTGTAAKPIIVKGQAGQRAIVDGFRSQSQNGSALTVKGAHTWFQGFEVTNSNPTRILSSTGSDPLGTRGEGLTVLGVGIKIINMVLYDNSNGLGAWSTAADNEYYGNLIYNNGWIAADRKHGHGIYSQNNTGVKTFGDNVILNNLSYGVQVYGSNTTTLNNYVFDGNSIYNDRWLIGGAAPAKNITVNGNFTYADTIEFGYVPALNTGLTLTNNIFSSTTEIRYWNNVTVKNNTIYDGPRYRASLFLLFNGTPNYSTFQFDNNTYHWSNPAPASQAKEPLISWSNSTAPDNSPNKSGTYLLSQWKQMGKDAQSTVEYFPQQSTSQMALNGIKAFVRKNKFDSNRANIIVYNYDRSNTVSANVDGVLYPGDTYELRNSADYFNDVVTGTYNGDPLSLPMTGHTVAKPIGLNSTMANNTFPEFGTFILIRTGKSALPSLPFAFLGFTAAKQNNNVVLDWSTENDLNSSNFSIERSTDGINYTSIGSLPAATTSVDNSYAYTDIAPAAGAYSYRIKRVAKDNSLSYSVVQQVNIAPPLAASFSFIDFFIQATNNNVAVQWITGLEYDSKRFTVERSSDGTNYSELATLNASANPQASNVYGYLDVTPPAGSYSYRIKRLAKDNSVTYSAVKQINLGTPPPAAFNFIDFMVQPVSTGIAVQWVTGLEHTSKSFTVERSSNGTSFSSLTTINASLNPQASNMYGYLDPPPQAGTYSYRIKRLAKDNSISYSTVKQITVGSNAKSVDFTIAQNPVTSTLQLQLSVPGGQSTTLRIDITNNTNQVRHSEQKTINGTTMHNIAVSQLLPGLYFVTITSPSGTVSKQFIKQ